MRTLWKHKMFFLYKIPKQNSCFFSFCFFVLLDMVRVHAKAGPLGRPHAAYLIRSFERTFFTLQKKPLLSDFTYLGLKQARPKNLQEKCKIFGTGSRRGATPGRLGAQNRWFSKEFCPEGRLHRTRGLCRMSSSHWWMTVGYEGRIHDEPSRRSPTGSASQPDLMMMMMTVMMVVTMMLMMMTMMTMTVSYTHLRAHET